MDQPSPATPVRRRPRRAWLLGSAVTAVVVAAGAVGIGLAQTSSSETVGATPPAAALGATPGPTATAATGTPVPATTGSHVQVGPGGFTVLPTEVSRWVAANPTDPRTPVIRDRIAAQPAALWLTGPESSGNLDDAVAQATREDSTLTLSLYDIPGRDDGLTGASGVTPAEYRSFVDRVVTTIGSTRAVVVVEPDALWFVDRQTPPGTQEYTDRIALLNYVVDAFAAKAPRSAVYLEAGTSSQSVTPARMAELLQTAGVEHAAGFAVDVSSFGPDREITAWAQDIRADLARSGATDVHYVVDTSRNGNPDWDRTWCNPSGRRIGAAPAVGTGADGLDATLWIKQPGTSDGSCGNGVGSYGGQFLPQVGYDQAS